MKEKELIPCRIGTADLVEEFMDILFDGELYTCNHNVYTGFVDGKPAVLHFVEHRIFVDYYKGNYNAIRERAQYCFDECDNEPSCRRDGYKRVALIGQESINLYYQEQ